MLKTYWDRISKYSKINGVVLMYHHVSDEKLDVSESCHHTIEQFKNSLYTYLNKGYVFVSIQHALYLIKTKSKQKFAVITFDDVPIDAYENAVPILKQMNLPFTFFITTGFIGTKGYMNEEQIKNLDNSDLCTIGAHTVTHPVLRYVSNSLNELQDSKEYLENLLGHPICYLAYPYGRQSSISRKVIKQAKIIGFDCAFSTIQTSLNDISSKETYFLPRIVEK